MAECIHSFSLLSYLATVWSDRGTSHGNRFGLQSRALGWSLYGTRSLVHCVGKDDSMEDFALVVDADDGTFAGDGSLLQ